MNCIADQCSQGREPCTRTECGYDSLLSPQERCDYLSDTARFAIGVAIVAALSCAGLAFLLAAFDILTR